MKVLYVVIGDLGRRDSGSGLRPDCMYYAFLERGHTVYTLSGHAGRREEKLRAAEVKKAICWVEENDPDLCYIESSTYPMLHSCDYRLIRYLHKKKVPTAYFYRDFYRMFPDLFPRRKGLGNQVKETYLDLMQKKTDRILELVDIVYFPSEVCFQYFSYQRPKTLPPAGEEKFIAPHENGKTCIYAGGCSEFYGFTLMMDAFRILNSGKETYRLILVCREQEYQQVKPHGDTPEWLEVHHVSGEALEKLYQKADIGLITLTQNAYSDLAVGTKLFQYLSYGLPVLATNTQAMASIILENGFGTVAPFEPEGFASTVQTMLDEEERLREYRTNILKNMKHKHLWVHRVDQIVRDLLPTETGEER